MTQKKHDNLVDHIREKLRMHEEPYQQEAWEEFQQYRNKRSRGFITKAAISVAASLILLLSLIYLIYNSGQVATAPETDIALQQPKAENQDENTPLLSSNPDTSTLLNNEEKPAPDRPRQDATALEEGPDPAGDRKRSEIVHVNADFFEVALSSPDSPKRMEDQKIRSGISDVPTWPVVTSDIHSVGQKEQQRFTLGMAYMPMMNVNRSNAQLGMGGGLYTDWKFSDRFAFSTGILVAKNHLEYDTAELTPGVESEDLANMRADLLSLEIPLNLKFYVTNDLSVSAGISSSAFMEEDYNYTYEYQREVQVLTLQEDDGYRTVTKKVTVRESERESAGSFSTIDFAAFYTFSLGYQYGISERHTLSLEPYLKLPTGDLTSKKIKYSTGGLQLKISF